MANSATLRCLGNSHENLLETPMLAITNAIPKLAEMFPMESPIKKEIFSGKLGDFLGSPSMPLAKGLLQSAGRLLQAKVRELSIESVRAFQSFAESACTLRGASAGHALVKT